MDRRELLLSGTAIAAGLMASTSALAKDKSTAAGSKEAALVDAALSCQKSGNKCLDHAVKMVANGNNAMVKCLAPMRDMLAVTETLAKLASTNSPHLKAYAAVAAQVCTATEKVCREHAKD